MYAHTTWPPPGGTAANSLAWPGATTAATGRVTRRPAPAADATGRWGR